MVDYLKILEKCRDTHCDHVVSKKELESTKNEYIKAFNKKCSKMKDGNIKLKCSLEVMKKSNYDKLIKKKSKCIKTKCKKEQSDFRKSFKKSFKKFRENYRNKKNKKSKKNSKKK